MQNKPYVLEKIFLKRIVQAFDNHQEEDVVDIVREYKEISRKIYEIRSMDVEIQKSIASSTQDEYRA